MWCLIERSIFVMYIQQTLNASHIFHRQMIEGFSFREVSSDEAVGVFMKTSFP